MINNIQMTFTHTHLDYAYGQNDYEIVARDGTAIAGVLSYSVPRFEKVAHINHIEVVPAYRQQGVGQQLIKQLLKHTIGRKIQWGTMTPEGQRLRQSLERQGYLRFFEWKQQCFD
jgi:GNAT superfamily N-acetyltransferase